MLFAVAISALASEPQPGTVPDVLVREHNSVVQRVEGAARDYSRNCQGCHGHAGYSVDEIPVLKDRVGYFVHTPEGRAYLVRVPNVAQAHLSDERLARLLNWLLVTYSARQMPADFTPYSAEEVGRVRRDKPDRVVELRKQVVEGLVARGVVASAEVLYFKNE